MSNTYTPDTWVVIKITNLEDGTFCYKVLGGWYGGYCGSDSWQLNSGICAITRTDTHYEFEGYSGSIYYCSFSSNRLSLLTAQILEGFIKSSEGRGQIEVLTREEVSLLTLN